MGFGSKISSNITILLMLLPTNINGIVITTNLGPKTPQIFVRKMEYSSTWLRPPPSKMRGSRIREYSPRMFTREGSVLIFFSVFPFWLFHVICSCVIGVESQVKWENSRVLGYYYKSEIEKRDLGISRKKH